MSGFNGAAFKGLTEADVVNNLTSTATDKPGSAAQLKVLNDKITDIGTYGKQICTWGAYNAVGTKITLSEAYTNFRFLAFVTGYAQNTEKGFITVLPLTALNYASPILINCSCIDSPEKYMALNQNSTTELEIKAVSSGFGLINSLRMILGIY